MTTLSDNDYRKDLLKTDFFRNSKKNKVYDILLSRLIIILFLSLLSCSLRAQDSLLVCKITITDTTCTVRDLLGIIEHLTSLSFSYNAGVIDEKKTVVVQADNEPLIDLLKHSFNDPSLDFKIVGRHLVIYRPMVVLSADPQNEVDSVLFFEIKGHVYDRLSKQPLPFANIYLIGRSVGTIANEDGGFLLKLSSEYFADTLNISHMGYKRHTAPVADLVNTDMKYFLDLDIISIQEVIIRKLSPISILHSAKSNIQMNYPMKPAILTSFYRETVKKGNRYMIVSEAILETFKPGYNEPYQQDQVKIIKGRKRQDINPTDTIMLKLKAGLNTMLLLDVIKYMPDFMTEEGYYDYIMADIVVNDDRDNYAIEFVPKERIYDAFYTGRIFIDVEDLSFKWVEFSIDPLRLKDATNLFVLKKPSNLNVRVLGASYEVAFRNIGDTYYLHHISCETSFRVRYKKQIFGTVYQTSLEMVVTQIDTVDVDRFRYRETARTYDVFTEQITDYDEAFWGEYNFIRPEDPLERAVIKLENAELELMEEE